MQPYDGDERVEPAPDLAAGCRWITNAEQQATGRSLKGERIDCELRDDCAGCNLRPDKCGEALHFLVELQPCFRIGVPKSVEKPWQDRPHGRERPRKAATQWREAVEPIECTARRHSRRVRHGRKPAYLARRETMAGQHKSSVFAHRRAKTTIRDQRAEYLLKYQ